LGARGLADRLAEARAGALVGREPERAVLDRMLSGAAHAPLVAYLHGPGGIGKSSLMRYAARQAQLAGRRVVHVDARFLETDPRRLEEAAAPACSVQTERRTRQGLTSRPLSGSSTALSMAG
jgi:predicted ATPase